MFSRPIRQRVPFEVSINFAHDLNDIGPGHMVSCRYSAAGEEINFGIV